MSSKKLVIIVVDNTPYGGELECILRTEYEYVQRHADGAKTLDFLQKLSSHDAGYLVLVDIDTFFGENFSGLYGLKFLEHLNDIQKHTSVPVVAVAYGQNCSLSIRNLARKQGAFDVISRPVDIVHINTILHSTSRLNTYSGLKKKSLFRPPLEEYTTTSPSHGIFPSITVTSVWSTQFDVALLNSTLASWDFDVNSYCYDDLLIITLQIFKNVGTFETLPELDMEIFKNFLLVVRDNYKSNPYHNYHHAVDVLQACYYFMIHSSVCYEVLTPLDRFALALAAYCHDVGHPGVNNYFMKNAKTALAAMYQEQSILENYHSALIFALISQPSLNFLSAVPTAMYNELYNTVTHTVLATDMGRHFEFVEKLNARFRASPLSRSSQDDRLLLAAGIIKSADINNQARRFSTAEKWSFAIMQEYFLQGQLEMSRDLPVFALGNENQVNIPKTQVDFINILAEPLYRAMSLAMPEIQFCLVHLTNNMLRWQQRLNDRQHDPSMPWQRCFSFAKLPVFPADSQLPGRIAHCFERRKSAPNTMLDAATHTMAAVAAAAPAMITSVVENRPSAVFSHHHTGSGIAIVTEETITHLPTCTCLVGLDYLLERAQKILKDGTVGKEPSWATSISVVRHSPHAHSSINRKPMVSGLLGRRTSLPTDSHIPISIANYSGL